MRSWNYFKDEEVAGLEHELVAKLDHARHLAGVPFIITSKRRTPEQNAAAGGVPDSAHVAGLAVDLRVDGSFQLFKMIFGAIQAGILRIVIGIRIGAGGEVVYHNLHLDIDTTKPAPVLAIKRYG